VPDPSGALILRADYEEATQYLAAYMGLIVEQARQRGFAVIDLHGVDATKTNFFDALQTSDPLLVIAGGHGNDNVFAGQNGEVVLEGCTNDQIMSGRQGIFNSCSVGVALGPSMVSKTAELFAGWRADYLFMLDEPMPEDPFQAVYARPFMECIIQPGMTRVNGGSKQQIYADTIAKFNYHLNQWWNSDDPFAQDVITLLLHDRDNFMVSGIYTPTILGNTALPILAVAGAILFLGG